MLSISLHTRLKRDEKTTFTIIFPSWDKIYVIAVNPAHNVHKVSDEARYAASDYCIIAKNDILVLSPGVEVLPHHCEIEELETRLVRSTSRAELRWRGNDKR